MWQRDVHRQFYQAWGLHFPGGFLFLSSEIFVVLLELDVCGCVCV